MKFKGPTHDGTNWREEPVIEVLFESIEELEQNYQKYMQASRAVVRTPTAAKPGEKKTLTFRLPDGSDFTVQATIDKVKEQPGKPFTISLFQFDDFTPEHRKLIEKALKPEADDLSFGDSEFDIPLTNDYAPPEAAAAPAPKPTTSKSSTKKYQSRPGRSAEEEAAVRAILSEEDPEDEDLIDVELPEELKGVAGDLIMPKKEGEEKDPWIENKKYLVAFILAFTKAVQRSGYYGDPNHPETVKAKKGLYALFRKNIGRHREISFIRKAIGGERDVLVDGVLDEMVTLKEIMPHGMAGLYIPRFLEYLERRCLISFSIKRVINEKNFNKFIDLLSQYSPEFRDDSRKEGERFTRTLIENGIYEVSAIFDEDIIASGRKLPWQAELTLSRLKKDLKTVPLLKNATEEELREIKIRIFQDTIRPLRNPSFMIAVLLNADLITENIEDSPVLKDINVEQFMIRGAEIKFLADTSFDVVKELLGVRELQIKAPLEAQRNLAKEQEKVLTRIVKHIADRFLEDKNPAADDALENFFEKKIIPFKILPLRLQERITNKKLMEAFLQNSDEILSRFNSHLSDKDFSDFMNRFQRVIPLLSDKREYQLVSRILESARKHLDDRDARRKSLTKRLFDFIASTNVLTEIKAAFETDNKELRNMATSVLVAFGRPAVPILLEILKKHEDKWVRKQVIRALIDIGAVGLQPIINELYKEDNPWYFLRNLIHIVGELGDRRIVGKLNLLLFNANPAVREETVNTLFRLAPDAAEMHLVKALDDQDARVREKAVYCLGMMKSQNEKVFRFYLDVLEGKTELENEALQIQVYRAVGNLSGLDETKRKSIEGILLGSLEANYGGGFFSFLRKGAKGKNISDGLKMAICTALGHVGSGKKTKAMLARVAREKDPILAQRANEALAAIQARGG